MQQSNEGEVKLIAVVPVRRPCSDSGSWLLGGALSDARGHCFDLGASGCSCRNDVYFAQNSTNNTERLTIERVDAWKLRCRVVF
jgi:hypothetical protein